MVVKRLFLVLKLCNVIYTFLSSCILYGIRLIVDTRRRQFGSPQTTPKNYLQLNYFYTSFFSIIKYKSYLFIFIGAGLVMVLVEFAVLLSTLFLCIKICKYRRSIKDREDETLNKQRCSRASTLENTYQRASPFAYSNDSYVMTNSFRQNYKLVNKAWCWLKGIIMPNSYAYDLRKVEVESMLW